MVNSYKYAKILKELNDRMNVTANAGISKAKIIRWTEAKSRKW